MLSYVCFTLNISNISFEEECKLKGQMKGKMKGNKKKKKGKRKV